MSLFRTASNFSRLARRAPLSARHSTASSRPFSATSARFAQGYGDGKGDPKGENPAQQGEGSKATTNLEHPGPKSPSAEQSESGAVSKEAKETGSSPTGGKIGGSGKEGESKSKKQKSKEGSSPQIQSRDEPASSDQADVDQHNKEFEQRHDRAQPAEDDKVDKKFWEGSSGGPKGENKPS